MVDMSASIIHHGHIRLLKAAAQFGYVIVALTTDDEIIMHKGFEPELDFESRKEILESIRYVDKVVPAKWKIDEAFLIENKIDYLIHGEDNFNLISKNRMIILPRTQNISSSIMREKAMINYRLLQKKFNRNIDSNGLNI